MNYFSQNSISSFTSPWKNDRTIYRQLEEFAKSLGWFPSDIVEEKKNNSLTGHLFVEHGLENSAVISFINQKSIFDDFTSHQRNELLRISYNNMVDFHISVDQYKVHGLNNRVTNGTPIFSDVIDNTFKTLRSDFVIESIKHKNKGTNLAALDDVLISTISHWKRILSAEINNYKISDELSNLFNAIILCRAIEDHQATNETKIDSEILLNVLRENSGGSFTKIFESVFLKLGITHWPENLIDKTKLALFNKIDVDTLENLFNDFYIIKNTPYKYDFSIISKHALSRIYERYVSELRVDDKLQLSFFPIIPEEFKSKYSGSYYTPQFIARFFSRYVLQVLPEFSFKPFYVVEPAVGSGIFLRSLLEAKFDYLMNYKSELIDKSFNSILGVDINSTACHSARLSLSLLYLIYQGKLPDSAINIINSNSLDYFDYAATKNIADICISNPPFVAYNALNSETRNKIKNVLGPVAHGRSDLYLAFLKIAIEVLKPNGLGLFIIPSTFLISESAKKLRNYLKDNSFIMCVVDLSDIQIFEDVKTYPILLIFQKINKSILKGKEIYNTKPFATIAKIQDKIGNGLSDILNRRKVESLEYNIYEVNQDYFKDDTWFLLLPTAFTLKLKLDSFSKLSKFAEVRTGFSSGASEIFIIEKKLIPKGESNIYVPYLSDREMHTYKVPNSTKKYFFYPFINGEMISEFLLKKKYPETYSYLKSKKKILSARNEVKQNKIEWWMPQRPRKPEFLMVPKILTPHLVLSPKFSIDIKGTFAVSRTPFLVLKEEINQPEMILYLTAVLNSSICFWYLLNLTPKYQQGYAMLEQSYLLNLPIPNPQDVDGNKINQIIKLVKARLISKTDKDSLNLEKKIDALISELYSLSKNEKEFLNLDF